MIGQTQREMVRAGIGGAPSRHRPRGLAVVVGLEVLLGVLGILGGVGSFSVTGLPQPEGLGFLQSLAPVWPVVMIGLGTFLLATSFGLWHGDGWAWTLAIGFEIVHVVADVGFLTARSFALDKVVGLAIILGTLYYLTRPGVRAYFSQDESTVH